MMKLKDVHQKFATHLAQIYDRAEAENIAWIVLEHLSGQRYHPLTSKDLLVSREQLSQLEAMETRLLAHEPVQYVLNEAWFYDIPFFVNEQVLIPRPETEELVDWILKENANKKNISILDIGTGSGCIPVILKRKLPDSRVYGCDISFEALKVAQQNAETYQLSIHFFQIDILDQARWLQLPKVDIIVSNPPYISITEKSSLHPNVAEFEPGLALFVEDTNPLLFYENIAALAPLILKVGGCMYLEIHEAKGQQILELYEKAGFSSVLKKDMQGKNRMLKAVRR